MEERFFDELAKSLAQPMARRRVVRLMGAALVAGAFASRSPRRASAASSVNCAAKPDLPFKCACPNGNTGLNFELCCWTGAACHCEPRAALCCPKPTVWDGKVCAAPCPPERSGCGLCCTPDQVCSQERKICCPRDKDVPCTGPEPACKKEADDKVKDYQNSTCKRGRSAVKGSLSSLGKGTSIDSMREGAYFSLGCFAFSEAVLRPSEYARCKQVPDTSKCADCGSSRRASAAAQTLDDAAAHSMSTGGWTQSRSGVVPGAQEVLREYRRYRSRFRADAVRLERALGQTPSETRTDNLVKALRAYRADVTALEGSLRQLQKKNPGAVPAAAYLLQLLAPVSSGLTSFQDGVEAKRKADATRHGNAARRSFSEAGRLAPRVRRALGCKQSC